MRTINQKAIVLVIALVTMLVLTITGAAVVSRSISESNMARRYLHSTQAFWLAEAATQRAIYALNNDDWSGWTVAGGVAAISAQLPNSTGTYSATITDLGTNNPTVSGGGDSSGVTRGIALTLARQAGQLSPFIYGAFGKNSVTISGNGRIDSYKSSLPGGYGGSNVNSNGDVATNGTSTGAVSLSGNARIYGDVNTGPGGTVSTSGNAQVLGSITHDSNETLPAINVPTELTSLASSGAYSESGNTTATVSSGEYKYSSFSLSGNAAVTINGEVKIYLTNTASALDISGNGKIAFAPGAQLIFYTEGRCSISGNGIVNQTNLPQSLQVYCKYSGSGGVTFSGNNDLHGAIYAPDTSVSNTGNSSVYGSFVGKSISLTGNGNLHYDEDLKNIGIGIGNTGHYSVQSWYEQTGPYKLIP